MKRSLNYVSRVVRRTRATRGTEALTSRRWQTARFASSESGGAVPHGLNTTNPFEIKFHTDDSSPSEPQADPSSVPTDAGSFEDEIELFHSEMVGVFGSEPEEYQDDGAQPAKAPTSANQTSGATVAQLSQSASTLRDHSAKLRVPTPPRRSESAGSASVVLIHGPCTYVHDGWVGSKDRWSPKEVAVIVDRLAQTHGLNVSQHHSNHEGQILDWLLNTSPGDKIVLNWNGRLVDSPVVYRALSSIRASVVILTPLEVELGPLPTSVKGVIAGFGTRSLELAIEACK